MDQQTILVLIGTPALCGFVVFVGLKYLVGGLADLKKLQRTPPLAEEVQRTYATKAEVSEMARRIEARIDAHEAAQNLTFSEVFTRIETKIAGVTDSIQDQTKALADWQLAVERQLGRHDAKIEAAAKGRG